MHVRQRLGAVSCLLLFLFALPACSAREKMITDAELESAAASVIRQTSDLPGDWKLLDRQETPNGVFLFYKNETQVAAVNFIKQEKGGFKQGLCTAPTRRTGKDGLADGSLNEQGIFTYILTGRKPEGAKALLLSLRDKNGTEPKEIRVPLDSSSPYIYYGYQNEFTGAIHIEYRVQYD